MPFRDMFCSTIKTKIYLMLRHSGSGPEIELPGQILTGKSPKWALRPAAEGRLEGRFRILPGSSQAKIRAGRPISGPEPLSRNIEQNPDMTAA